jgi:integration host factor subunit beta
LTKAELIEKMSSEMDYLSQEDIKRAVNILIDTMSSQLSKGKRIEVRGFGSFSVIHRASRIARNPKTGESVRVPDRCFAHFKPGKDLKERVTDGLSC